MSDRGGNKDGGNPPSVTFDNQRADMAALHQIIPQMNAPDIPRFVGARPGDTIGVSSRGFAEVHFHIMGTGQRSVAFDLVRERGLVAVKEAYVHNKAGKAHAEQQMGMDLLRTLSVWRAMGVNRIFATAQAGRGYNGYLLWAKLGFTGAIPFKSFNAATRADFAAKFPGIGTVQGLMAVPARNGNPSGADWWAQNGKSWEAEVNFSNNTTINNLLDRFDRRGG